MDPLFVWILTISLMFTGGNCMSQSMSCSTVNGKTVCESQRSNGNVAGSAASANSGPGGSFQDAAAMTGNSNTGQSQSSRTSVGNMPGGGAWAGNMDPRAMMGPGFPFNFVFGRR